MVILVADRPNKVGLKVNAAIDISGFSAILAACGVLKTIDKIDTDNISFEYTAEEVARTSESGTYGTLIVYDADGKEYLKYWPFFQRVGSGYEFKAIGNQTIYITIASTKGTKAASEGGGGVTPVGDYVTKEELDEAISNVTVHAIQEQPVEVSHGGTTTEITVQQAVQSVYDMQETVAQAMETHLTGETKDEDGDGQPDGETLYLNTHRSS